MKQKLQTILKKVPYWMGIVVFGTILGLTLQFASAWTEPLVSAPNGNVGAPITTGISPQNKSGIIGSIAGGAYGTGALRFGTASLVSPGSFTGDTWVRTGNADGTPYGGIGLAAENLWSNKSSYLAVEAGNVGIGTVNPTQKLDVAGNIKGTGLCIGGDCRSAWPAAPAITCPCGACWSVRSWSTGSALSGSVTQYRALCTPAGEVEFPNTIKF